MKPGWITPTRRVIECRDWEHLTVVAADAELVSLCPDMARLLSDLAKIEADCDELSENGEHPEWHNYEMAESEARREIWRKLLDAGCIRIGLRGDEPHFEGKPQALHDAAQFIASLCGDTKPILEPI